MTSRVRVAASILFLLVSFRQGQAGDSTSVPADSKGSASVCAEDYCAGPDDLLSVTVLEAPDLSRPVRVSASGEISLPLIGVFQVANLTPRAIELLLQDRLQKTYMRDPHVSVQVLEMQSHSISVMGAVNKPGTFQIRGPRTLLEVLSLAGGVSADAGDQVIVTRGNAAGGNSAAGLASAPSEQVQLKDLIKERKPTANILVFPNDLVKVVPAGMVYIVGEVNKPGAFPMSEHEKLTVLRALALGEGLTRTASKNSAVIIRTLETGSRVEVPVALNDMLKGKVPDVDLQPRDIVFVHNSTSRSVTHGVADAMAKMLVIHPY
jgi:polysaccharide biosynthesis/export protein